MGRSQERPDGRGITLQLSGPVRSASVQTMSRFRADVEGLRAVAVLAVVVYHAGLSQLGGGFVGVDVFYVLSGFLITGLLWEELQATGRLRLGGVLWPAGASPAPGRGPGPDGHGGRVVGLAVAAAGTGGCLGRGRGRAVGGQLPVRPPAHRLPGRCVALAAAALLVAGGRGAVLLAVAAAAAGRVPGWATAADAASAGAVAALALAGAGSLALSLRLTARSAPWAFLSLPTRAWELAAGGLIALSASTLRRLPGVAAATLGWLGLEAIAWSMTRFSAATPFPGTAALLPVGGTAMVLAAGCAAPRLGPGLVLGWWPLQAGGKLSYSWYLWHWPLLVLAPAVAGHPSACGRILAWPRPVACSPWPP